ncbi:Type I restriction-modification system, restriction subunit R [Candidatus Nitrotoga sp. HW29]|uniref:type I restriction endonuclease subunit R n=1 Tax=Candidatus Nitrotoga sp. HW29 TaxID=2886963 RepID=UPI001EF1B1A4|nr:HsdR family type I site-specific deoxyribonuclease [Candidatus Nitrotoga sp. HW29]CAH1903561.1 Type I restriction-modification system, restriction subunit R [Candidatus Nitrotoga sp. HW29]
MLEKVHFDEAKQSQLTAIELLLAMGYEYISAEEAFLERGSDTSNFILANIASKKLMEINEYDVDGKSYKFSEKDVQDTVDELEHIQYEGLIDTAQKIYNIIMPTSGGKTIKVRMGGKSVSKNFRFIDFEYPERNAFHVTAEFVASGKQNIRPDIVCFVNGIPFAVIENKKSSVAVIEAINQMNRNQGPEFCPKLFTYAQLLMGSNGKELQYGTTGTPNKFYAVWKEKNVTAEEINERAKELIAKKIDDEVYEKVLKDLNGYTDGHKQKTKRLPTEQDRGVLALFEPARLLDLTKNYILFDAGVKKLSRYQQYFAIHKMLVQVDQAETLESGITRRKGGLVWHTQGSGKSLTMVMFVKALIESPHISNPRVIIVTDRKDLDKQIKDTFKNCNLKKEVIQATSGQHLLDLIKERNLGVITTIIDKFESAAKKRADFVDADQNIFVLIDEAHRSQSGIASLEMNRIIPNACYIGFTGTPLMKKDKESWKKFGGYIDKYTIDDALADNIILPLIYEGRYVDLVQNEEQIDRHVERITEGLNDKKKIELQKYIGTKVIKDNPQRIVEIGYDIEKHFTQHFQDTGLKAQIVAPSKFSAVLFQKFFQERGNIRTAVVVSDEHDDGDEANTHKAEVVKYLDGIRKNHSSVAKYEKDVIDSFKYNEDGIEVIIVVDKLLTGFDAPRNTVLYLAKDLKDHNLLQAIARVNRLHENKKLPKTAGYIIDYSENAKNIDTAMKLFGNYDEADVHGTLIDVADKIEELEQSYGLLHDIFKTIKGSSDDEAFLQLLDDAPIRETFYKTLNAFIKNLNECFVLQDFVHEFEHLDMYTRELKKFMELRKTASLKYADRVDLAEYKQSLVNILDKYVDAKGVELLTKQINITDRKQFEEAIETLGSDKSKAEAIAAQTQKTISEKLASDPEFYERFSRKISEILKKMRDGKLADVAAFKQLKLIGEDVVNKKDDTLPDAVEAVKGSDVFYRNLREDFKKFGIAEDEFIAITLDIFGIVKDKAIVDWYKNLDVKRRMMNSLDDYLYDVVQKEKGIDLSDADMRSIINSTLTLAENNYEIFA